MGRRSRKRVEPVAAERRAAPPNRGRGPAPGPQDGSSGTARSRAPARHDRSGGGRTGRRGTPRTAAARPRAPWHPLPLVELSVLVGIILIVLGLFVARGDRGRALLVFGLALASLGGLDTALREHVAGFRAHSALLAGVPAVLLGGTLAVAGAPRAAVAPAAVLTYAAAFGWARRAFRVRSEGRR